MFTIFGHVLNQTYVRSLRTYYTLNYTIGRARFKMREAIWAAERSVEGLIRSAVGVEAILSGKL